jgi:hypothetical protein
MRLLYNMTFVVGLKMQTLMEKSNITQRLADLEKGVKQVRERERERERERAASGRC